MNARRETTLLWLQSGGCGGCTMAMITAESPDFATFLEAVGIRLLWHPSMSLETGAEAFAIFDAVLEGREPLDILCLEGAVMRGPDGTGRYHLLSDGSGRTMMELLQALAHRARHVLAVGSCAAWGGVTAAGGNGAEACGLAYEGDLPGGLLGPRFVAAGGLPVVNVPGCAPHPGWILETLMSLADDALTADDLDDWGRPLSIFGHLAHHGCPRNEYYEFKASAEQLSDLGCMMEHLGCKGTQAAGDCNRRSWNGGGSCLKGGFPCIACTEPMFEQVDHPFVETPKVAGIPVGLPTDMPKAWFVALASLSKAATPERLRRNAIADRTVLPPGTGKRRRRP